MIIVRSPLRITFGGGGTDIPSYYTQRPYGFSIATTINQYITLIIHPTVHNSILLKYAKTEQVQCIKDIQHPIIQQVLKTYKPDAKFLEIISLADIPSGTGLASSSAFTAALIKGIFTLNRIPIDFKTLSKLTCDIEINKLKEPIGKQDQYISAYGGLKALTFYPDETVNVQNLQISPNVYENLNRGLSLFYTGKTRSASSILAEQVHASKNNDSTMFKALDETLENSLQVKKAIESEDLQKFGFLLNEQWNLKKKRSKNMSNPHIDEWYAYAKKHGALGGKLIGAGGGGFLLFYSENPVKLNQAMAKIGLKETFFQFETLGTHIIIND